ncbi:hypothetical protein QWJ90_07535 [Microbacterium oryzae]|uniref:hypothetical protein n=1 Tax=Microbacterium oryzae TaxID=743009 RepID=UPI0025B0F38A|nr:hypothetical protein [Microbacterium oryzae]MDN3310778.1 hypothetical protein [Microbacterium oryzae]
MRKTKLALTALAVTTSAAILLTGCSTVEDVLHKEKRSTYENPTAFDDDSGIEAPWLPEDATGIEVTRSTQANDAAISAESYADLSSALCAPVERQSAPAYQPGPEVDVFKISHAFACGDWTVVKTDYGWLGWTPGHPDEKAQSPS